MSSYFSENDEVSFDKGKTFIIKEIVGRGASSVVYRAIDAENHTEHLLKEYHPSHISLVRKENGNLAVLNQSDRKQFQDGLDRFLAGCKLQRKFRDDPDLKNVTSNIQDIHHGYGTVFIDMTYFSGKSYEKITEKTLSDLIRRIRALTQTIAHYHNKGYLHLDLKPENIFALPETSEMIMLFDFDSVIEKTELRNMNARLSYTPKWAAPELLGSNPFGEVSESTDLYSIGMIFFHKLTGRFPAQDQLSSGRYLFDTKSRLLKNVNKRVLSLLSAFFESTLCEVKECRWQTAEEVIDALEELLNAVNRPQRSNKVGPIAAILICIPVTFLVFCYLLQGAWRQAADNPETNPVEILNSEPCESFDEGMQAATTEPTVHIPDDTTWPVETSPEVTESIENTSNVPTEESTFPSYTDPVEETTQTTAPTEINKVSFSVDTIAYTSDNFRSLIVTNDGVVYYLDGSIITNSSDNISIDMQYDFDEPLKNGYLAYDPYNDIVYLLAGGSLSIYDISNLSSPVLVMNNTGISLQYKSGLTPQIAVLSDGSLLVPADLDGTYRINLTHKHVAPFSRIYYLQSPYYAKIVGDYILKWKGDSVEAKVSSMFNGHEYDIQLTNNAPYHAACSVQDKVWFYDDGVGVCHFGIDGKVEILIAQEDIKIKDYQSLNYTNIWSISASRNLIIAFYDNTLKCIRYISQE